MIHNFVDSLALWLDNTSMSNWLIVVFLSFLPIVETRLGLPIGLKLGMGVFSSWFFAFIGSSLAIPVVVLLFMPIISKIKTKLKRKKTVGFFDKLYQNHAKKISEKLQKNQAVLDTSTSSSHTINKKSITRLTNKKMLATILFVALPGPMTGVWGGSVVASILKLNFLQSCISVLIGNLIASILVLIFVGSLYIFIDYIIILSLVLAVISCVVLLIKYLLSYKKSRSQTTI